MRVFYKSKLAKWMLWQGYSTINFRLFRLYQEKQGGNENTRS